MKDKGKRRGHHIRRIVLITLKNFPIKCNLVNYFTLNIKNLNLIFLKIGINVQNKIGIIKNISRKIKPFDVNVANLKTFYLLPLILYVLLFHFYNKNVPEPVLFLRKLF